MEIPSPTEEQRKRFEAEFNERWDGQDCIHKDMDTGCSYCLVLKENGVDRGLTISARDAWVLARTYSEDQEIR